jgi:hypothetical protein
MRNWTVSIRGDGTFTVDCKINDADFPIACTCAFELLSTHQQTTTERLEIVALCSDSFTAKLW